MKWKKFWINKKGYQSTDNPFRNIDLLGLFNNYLCNIQLLGSLYMQEV